MRASHDCPVNDPSLLLARPGKSRYLPPRGVLMTLATVALLLLLAGCWWHWHIPTYRLCGRYPAVDYTLLGCTSGFWMHESPRTFVLRDWNGKERWRANLAQTKISGQRATPRVLTNFGYRTQSPLSYAASSDGRVFAAAMPAGTQTRVQIWRDGALTGDLLLPAPVNPVPQRWVHALDNGRVFVWDNAPEWPVTVIDNGRIVARGHFPAWGLISSDGRTVVSPFGNGFTYADLTVRDGVVRVTPRYHGADPLAVLRMPDLTLDNSSFINGYVLSSDGAVYNHAGRVSPATTWQHETVAPGRRYTLQHIGAASRVYSPLTGDTWSFFVHGENKGGDAIADGRYALAYCTTRIPPDLLKLLQAVPGMEETFTRMSLDYLALYERPGRLRAVLRLDRINLRPSLLRIDDYWWYPSPDGRTIAMTITGNASECLVFRW